MLFLTAEEIKTLTGRKRPGGQIAVLQKRRIPYELDGDNRPVVARDTVLQRFIDSGAKKAQCDGPDWSAI